MPIRQPVVSTVLERIFAVDSNTVTRLKHKISPSLTYEFGKFSNVPLTRTSMKALV